MVPETAGSIEHTNWRSAAWPAVLAHPARPAGPGSPSRTRFFSTAPETCRHIEPSTGRAGSRPGLADRVPCRFSNLVGHQIAAILVANLSSSALTSEGAQIALVARSHIGLEGLLSARARKRPAPPARGAAPASHQARRWPSSGRSSASEMRLTCPPSPHRCSLRRWRPDSPFVIGLAERPKTRLYEVAEGLRDVATRGNAFTSGALMSCFTMGIFPFLSSSAPPP